MQKISIVTITCRTNPRLAEAGRTIAASLARCEDVSIQWIIVDELERDLGEIFGAGSGTGLPVSSPLKQMLATDRLRIGTIAPPETEHRTGPDKAVAHNSARNAGLLVADGDYVVFLNDCNVATADWVAVARDCSKQGWGWKCKTDSVHDLKIPDDGIVRYKDHHDLLRPVPHTVVAGPVWGVPRAALMEIGGFDLAYDGQRHGNDVDAIIRLSRAGVTFVTTARAYTRQLRRTKIDSEVTTRKDVYVGARNQVLINQLLADKARIHPIQPSEGFGVKAIAPAASPPAKPEVVRRRAGAPVAPIVVVAAPASPRPPRRPSNPPQVQAPTVMNPPVVVVRRRAGDPAIIAEAEALRRGEPVRPNGKGPVVVDEPIDHLEDELDDLGDLTD